MTTEMVEAALRILSADRPKGFFLFVEECVADKAGHRSDAAATVLGILELDRAVAAAYRFYQKHRGETLLIVTADHETGGLQWLLGYDWLEKIRAADRRDGERSPVARLASVHASIAKTVKDLDEQLTPEQRARLRWRYRQFQFSPEFERALEEGRGTLGKLGQKWDSVLSYLVARNTGAYYSGGAHSLAPVPLFAVGVGAERFNGHLDNADVGRTLFRLAGRQDFRSVRPTGPETYVSRPPRATPRATPRPTPRAAAARRQTPSTTYDRYTQENEDEESQPSATSRRTTSSRSRTSDLQGEDD
jgi:alkaline phosphatase